MEYSNKAKYTTIRRETMSQLAINLVLTDLRTSLLKCIKWSAVPLPCPVEWEVFHQRLIVGPTPYSGLGLASWASGRAGLASGLLFICLTVSIKFLPNHVLFCFQISNLCPPSTENG